MKIRKSMKSTIARVLMMIVALTVLGGYGITRMIMKSLGSEIDGIASVNGADISFPLFQHTVYEEDQKNNLIRQRYGSKTDVYMKLMGMSTDPKATALKQLVTEEIVKQYADSLSITLSDNYIDEKLANPHFIMNEIGHILPSSVFTQDGKINVYALTQFMAMPEMAGIRLQLADKIRSQFALVIAQSAFYIPDFMTKDFYVSRHVAKKFSVQKFDVKYFKNKAKSEHVGKEELRNFYEQKATTERWYWVPEQRFGTVWEFTAADYGIEVSDAEIAEYYAKNKTSRYIEKPAQFKVREIIFNKVQEKGLEGLRKDAEAAYARVLSNPELFADIAKEVSQNADTAVNGGLVNYFSRGTKDKEYEKATVRLKNNGDITALIKTAEGFAIVQRVDRKEPVFSSLEKVRSSIVASLTEQKFRRTFAKDADKVAKEHNEDAFVAFVKKHGGHKKNVGPVEKNNQNDFQRIFSIRNEGDTAVFVENGKGVMLTLTEKKARHLPVFSSMIEQVTHEYEEERAYVLLQDAINTAKNLAVSERSLTEVEGSRIETTGFLLNGKNDLHEDLVLQGYPEGFMFMTSPGQTIFNATKKGGILVRLDELKSEDLAGYNEQKLSAEGEVYQTISNLFTSACLASLFRTATINVNKELIHGKDTLL